MCTTLIEILASLSEEWINAELQVKLLALQLGSVLGES